MSQFHKSSVNYSQFKNDEKQTNLSNPAFEDLIGHRGGLGALQTQAIMFFPQDLAWENPVSDSTQMHNVLKEWKFRIQKSDSKFK